MLESQTTPFPPQQKCNKFYKYVKYEDCLKILSEGTLWFSKPVKFNDPFDCYPYFPQKGKDKVFNRLNNQFSLDRRVPMKTLRKNLAKMSQTGTGGIMHHLVSNNLTVTCFSTNHLSAPMWAHYADEHQGCVVEFQLTNEIINKISQTTPSEPIIVPFHVNYSGKRPPLYDKNGDMYGLDIALSKSTQWSYEQEVRALSNREGIHHFSRYQITKVFTGVRITDINKAKVKNTVLQMNKDLNTRCKLVELSMAFDSYNFVELD